MSQCVYNDSRNSRYRNEEEKNRNKKNTGIQKFKLQKYQNTSDRNTNDRNTEVQTKEEKNYRYIFFFFLQKYNFFYRYTDHKSAKIQITVIQE